MTVSASASERTVLSCFGIQRSGNHAIIGWILDGIQGRCLHLNHVFSPHPFQSFDGAEARQIDLREYLVKRSIWQRIRRPKRFDPNGPISNWEFDRRQLTRSPWEWLMVGWENKFLYDHAVQRYFFRREKYVASDARWIQLMILRDPYNHFASLMRSGRLEGHGLALYTALWKQYAREYLTPRFLPAPVICVNFNRWVSSAEYRICLARKIGFETDSAPYGRTPEYGGGSSFEGKVEGRPQGITERWRVYQDDPEFASLFDEEIVALGEEIFSMPNPFR